MGVTEMVITAMTALPVPKTDMTIDIAANFCKRILAEFAEIFPMDIVGGVILKLP
jgi:hypothetical protein